MIKTLASNPDARWLNLFIRDFLIIMAIGGLQYMTNFNSKVVFFLMGMIVVHVTWHFSDFMRYLKIKRGLKK